MPAVTRTAPAAVLAAAIAISAAACGSAGTSGASALAGLTADQIITKAVHDLSLVSSVQEVGTEIDSGQGFAIDVTVVRGQGCRGTMALPVTGSSAGDAADPVALVYLNGTVYMKYDKNYMEKRGAPAATITAVAGKYIEVTSGSAVSDFAQSCELSEVVSGLEKDETGFTKDGTATVDGQAALGLKGQESGQKGIVYVSESATPEILRFQALPTSQGSINFLDYNAKVTITAPPTDDIVPVGSLGS